MPQILNSPNLAVLRTAAARERNTNRHPEIASKVVDIVFTSCWQDYLDFNIDIALTA